jgi:hypothetical protein
MERVNRANPVALLSGAGGAQTMGALGVSALLVATGVGIGMHSLETLRAVTAAELVL